MAESNAEITSNWVVTSGATMPLPMVVATAVPVSAPMMLRIPAINTAVPGFSTRVATEVAMAFAVSWKPLMKSKMRPMMMIKISRKSAGLGILHHNPLQRISDILGAVGGIFQLLIDFSPANGLDETAHITHAIELSRQRPVEHIVSLTLQPVDVYRALEQFVPLLPIFQQRHCTGDERGL